MKMTVIAAVAGAAAAMVLGACSSESAVAKGDLANEVKTQLGTTVGHQPESVTCPDDLPAKVGASTTCSLSDSGETYGVEVAVIKVDGSDVKFDIKVDQKPS